MRLTVTLAPNVEALVRKAMSERGTGLTQVVNDGLRRGLRGSVGRAYSLAPRSMGAPRVPLDAALSFAARLEDEELIPHQVLAQRDRGAFASAASSGSAVDDLLAERRAEARRDDS